MNKHFQHPVVHPFTTWRSQPAWTVWRRTSLLPRLAAWCVLWGLSGLGGAALAAPLEAAPSADKPGVAASGPTLPEPKPPRGEGRTDSGRHARCEACEAHHAGSHQGHGGPRAARRGQWMEPSMDPDRMAQRLGLTPEQQAQFKPWAQAQRERMQALMQEGRSLRDSGRGLLSAAQRDDKAVAAWRERMLAHQAKMAQARLDQWIGMTQWMTPEQRSRWAQRPIPSGLDRRMKPMGSDAAGRAPASAPRP